MDKKFSYFWIEQLAGSSNSHITLDSMHEIKKGGKETESLLTSTTKNRKNKKSKRNRRRQEQESKKNQNAVEDQERIKKEAGRTKNRKNTKSNKYKRQGSKKQNIAMFQHRTPKEPEDVRRSRNMRWRQRGKEQTKREK